MARRVVSTATPSANPVQPIIEGQSDSALSHPEVPEVARALAKAKALLRRHGFIRAAFAEFWVERYRNLLTRDSAQPILIRKGKKRRHYIVIPARLWKGERPSRNVQWRQLGNFEYLLHFFAITHGEKDELLAIVIHDPTPLKDNQSPPPTTPDKPASSARQSKLDPSRLPVTSPEDSRGVVAFQLEFRRRLLGDSTVLELILNRAMRAARFQTLTALAAALGGLPEKLAQELARLQAEFDEG